MKRKIKKGREDSRAKGVSQYIMGRSPAAEAYSSITKQIGKSYTSQP